MLAWVMGAGGCWARASAMPSRAPAFPKFDDAQTTLPGSTRASHSPSSRSRPRFLAESVARGAGRLGHPLVRGRGGGRERSPRGRRGPREPSRGSWRRSTRPRGEPRGRPKPGPCLLASSAGGIWAGHAGPPSPNHAGASALGLRAWPSGARAALAAFAARRSDAAHGGRAALEPLRPRPAPGQAAGARVPDRPIA